MVDAVVGMVSSSSSLRLMKMRKRDERCQQHVSSEAAFITQAAVLFFLFAACVCSRRQREDQHAGNRSPRTLLRAVPLSEEFSFPRPLAQ